MWEKERKRKEDRRKMLSIFYSIDFNKIKAQKVAPDEIWRIQKRNRNIIK